MTSIENITCFLLRNQLNSACLKPMHNLVFYKLNLYVLVVLTIVVRTRSWLDFVHEWHRLLKACDQYVLALFFFSITSTVKSGETDFNAGLNIMVSKLFCSKQNQINYNLLKYMTD